MLPNDYQCKVKNEFETQYLAKRLAQNYLSTINLQSTKTVDIDFTIHLNGQLGVGKTSFTRSFLKAFGVRGKIKSPTYTLIESYEIAMPKGSLQAYHFDLYRMKHPSEWFDAGFDEHFAHPALRIIEWSSRAKNILPQPDCDLFIELEGGNRIFNIKTFSQTGKNCLDKLSSKNELNSSLIRMNLITKQELS